MSDTKKCFIDLKLPSGIKVKLILEYTQERREYWICGFVKKGKRGLSIIDQHLRSIRQQELARLLGLTEQDYFFLLSWEQSQELMDLNQEPNIQSLLDSV